MSYIYILYIPISTPPLPGESRKSKKELTAAAERGAALAAPALQPSVPSEEEVSRGDDVVPLGGWPPQNGGFSWKMWEKIEEHMGKCGKNVGKIGKNWRNMWENMDFTQRNDGFCRLF